MPIMLLTATVLIGMSGWIGEYVEENTKYILYGASIILATTLVMMEKRVVMNRSVPDDISPLPDFPSVQKSLDTNEEIVESLCSSTINRSTVSDNIVLTSLVDHPIGSIRILVGPNGAFGGRLATNEIILEDSVVSRVHFHLSSNGGQYYIQDCGSTTGTFLYLAPLEKRRLKLNDNVKVGDSEFTVIGLQEDYWSNTKPTLRLKFISGPMCDVTQTVGLSVVTIGRRTTCSLCLESDIAVSGQHCTIEYMDAAKVLEPGFYLTDLKSTNGTGIRLSPSRDKSARVLLHHKDVFGVGATKFLVEHLKDLEIVQGPVRIA